MTAAWPQSRMAPWRAALWSLALVAGMAQAELEPLGPVMQVTGLPDHQQIGVQIAQAADGSYALLWHEFKHDSPLRAAYVRAFNADGTPRGPAHAVDPFLGADAYNRSPRLVMADSGRFLVAWLDVGIVKGRHFAEDGTPMGPSKLLVPTTIGLLPESWQIEMAPDGSYVVMTQTQTQTPTGVSTVMLYRFTADGRARLPQVVALRAEIGAELRLLGLPNYEFQRSDLDNSIAIDGQGNVVLATYFITQTRYKPGTAVLRSGTPSESYRGQLQLRRISPNGLPVGRVVTVATYETADRPVYLGANLAAAADGSVALSWSQPGEGLKLWQFSPDLTLSAPAQLVRGGFRDIADNGNVAIAWSDERDDGSAGGAVHVRIHAADGSVLGDAMEPGDTMGGTHFGGQVSMDGQGSFLFSWIGRFRQPDHSLVERTYLRRYSVQ